MRRAAPTRRSVVAAGLLAAGGARLAGAATLSGPAADPDSPPTALRALIAQGVRADAEMDPIAAAKMGGPAAARFPDSLSDAYAARRLAQKRQDMARLEAIDRARLSPDDALAWDVFRYKTAQGLEDFGSGLFEIERLTPLDPSFGLQVTFPDVASGEGVRFETVTDYEAGLARLDGFSGWLASAVERLKEGRGRGYLQPAIVTRNVIAEVDVMLAAQPDETPFFKPLRTMPATIGPADRARLQAAYRVAIRDRVLPGYRLWKTWLSETYLPVARDAPGLWAMKDGDRVYAAALARHTTTSLTADQIHELGLSEVARIRGEMEAVRGDLGWSGDLHGLFEHVRTDPSFYYNRPEDLLARFKAIEAKIWEGMPRLFDRRPRAAFEVRPLPSMGAARGTGYFSLGAPDGSTPGVLYFNMSMLSTRPIPTLETLTLHEGIPGHYFQGSLAQENTALPDILRFGGGFTAYVEGWGLYSESQGKALGLFTDPWQWFGHLDFEMLRAVRLVVDTGIHAKRWSRDRAIAFTTANTSMAAKDIVVEIDRYIAAPGQATAYKIGELKFHELRGRAEKALGPRFDVRAFHDQVLMTGSMPLALLETRVDAWIAAGGPAYA